jgi:hypothetical protein
MCHSFGKEEDEEWVNTAPPESYSKDEAIKLVKKPKLKLGEAFVARGADGHPDTDAECGLEITFIPRGGRVGPSPRSVCRSAAQQLPAARFDEPNTFDTTDPRHIGSAAGAVLTIVQDGEGKGQPGRPSHAAGR